MRDENKAERVQIVTGRGDSEAWKEVRHGRRRGAERGERYEEGGEGLERDAEGGEG